LQLAIQIARAFEIRIALQCDDEERREQQHVVDHSITRCRLIHRCRQPRPNAADNTDMPVHLDVKRMVRVTAEPHEANSEEVASTPPSPSSWFEKLSYAAVVGAALALPTSKANAGDQKPLAERMTPTRMMLVEKTGHDFRDVLNELYAGALKELHDLYRERGLSAHPEIEAQAQRVVDKAIDRLTQDWAPHERRALANVMTTLDQLAGGDRRFNDGDKIAVIDALLRDKAGILRMVHEEIDKRVPGLGNRIAHRLVDNAYTPTRHYMRTGHAGVFQRMRDRRREKIETTAAQVMQQKLNETLRTLKVDPATAQRLDLVCRNLTIDQVANMASDLEILKSKLTGMKAQPETRPALDKLRVLLRENVDVVAPPLRNGVPSPKSLDAIIDTALDAAEGLRLRK
jgi:hypothetical protein